MKKMFKQSTGKVMETVRNAAEGTRDLRDRFKGKDKEKDKDEISQNDLDELISTNIIQEITRLAGGVTTCFHVGIASEDVIPKNKGKKDGKGSKNPMLQYQITPDSCIPQDMARPTVFTIGSLIKTLINLCVYRIVEHGAGVRPEAKKIMAGSWKHNVFELLNTLRSLPKTPIDQEDPAKKDEFIEKEKPIEKTHSLRKLNLEHLLHHRGLDPLHPHIFAPDGAFLMSTQTFEKSIASLANAHETNPKEWKYSNCNHMLASLIIRAATGKSLAKALKEIVLDEFEMNNTFLQIDEYERLLDQIERDRIATPHVVDLDGIRHEVEYLRFVDDDVALATGGGLSSTEDFSKMFQVVMAGLFDKNSKYREFIDATYPHSTIDGIPFGSNLNGIRTTVDSALLGSQSLDPTKGIDPDKSTKQILLGPAKNPAIRVVVKAGAVRGYSCHYFLVPNYRMYVIVFTNATGIIDASLHIGQYILKQLLHTQDELDFVKEVSELLDERKQKLQASLLNPVNRETGFDKNEFKAFEGHFQNDATGQIITITAHEDHEDLCVLFSLLIEVIGEASEQPSKTVLQITKKPLQLFKDSTGTLRVAPFRKEEFAGDTYVVWWELEFEFSESKAGSHGSLVCIDKSDRGSRTIYDRVAQADAPSGLFKLGDSSA
jgi:CubicO group peptidase (beta-lactamase class C family)